VTSIKFSELPDSGFASALQVTAGRGTGQAEMFVLVDAGEKRICVEIRPDGPQAYPFRDAVIWKDLVVIGFGSALYVIGLQDLNCRVHDFTGYFGSLKCSDANCLVASDEGVLCLSADGTALWHQRGLAADGVLIQDVSDKVIRGEGQWDPPDGDWVPFRLDLETGRPLPS
jgi:hypothetical protein